MPEQSGRIKNSATATAPEMIVAACALDRHWIARLSAVRAVSSAWKGSGCVWRITSPDTGRNDTDAPVSTMVLDRTPLIVQGRIISLAFDPMQATVTSS